MNKKLDPSIYLENVLTVQKNCTGIIFLKAFEVADNMQDGTTKGFPSVSKNWDEVISTNVHAFAYLKPTLELMKVKIIFIKNVSEESIYALAKGEPIYQEKPFINNVEKASTQE